MSNMRNYRLHELNWQEFEQLCSRICIKILGTGFINFAHGKDGGRDGKFEGKAESFPSKSKPHEGKFIVQAKYTDIPAEICSNKKFDKILEKELPKIATLVANKELDHYIMFTNRKLTAGAEEKLRKKVLKEVNGLKSFTIWGTERIHLFLDNNKDLHNDFGFDQPRTPFHFAPEDLEKLIKGFRKQVPKDKSKNSIPQDFLFPERKYKDKLNNVSKEYADHIDEDSAKHFTKIYKFLTNPRNEDLKEIYEATAYDLKGQIIAKGREYEYFDEVIEDILEDARSKWKCHGVDQQSLKIFIHFMYCSCDIGRKETEDART